MTYTLRVVNPTEQAALQVRVDDAMPETLEIVSATSSAGVVRIQGQNIIFTQSRLEAGGRVTITVITRVRQRDTGADQIVNRACLTSLSNQTPSCAQMRFVRAGELPSTGESPHDAHLFRTLLLLTVGGIALAVSHRVIAMMRR